jgi:hypothetical protein
MSAIYSLTCPRKLCLAILLDGKVVYKMMTEIEIKG